MTGARLGVRPRLAARDRRALRLAALVVVPALLVVRGVLPGVRMLSDTRDAVAGQRALLARELGLLRAADRYPRALRDADSAIADELARLFDGPDALSASAALGSYVAERAAASGLLLQASEGGEGATLDGAPALRLDIRATGDLEAILLFLRAMETGPRLVRVETVAIERSTRFGAPSDSAGTLTLSAALYGFAAAALVDVAAETSSAAHAAGGTP